MKKGHTLKTQSLNLDAKSQLAKLIATENIVVQHNNVKTASFDTKSRVLTLPIFKVKSGDVYDMLIAHECAHALYTPTKAWEKLNDKNFRQYVNVLEDCRIDAKIKKKYPGVVRNYMNGFDILDDQDFFGLTPIGDLDKNLMFIDKINLHFKSSFRRSFKFSNKDHDIIARVKEMKTFKDVLKMAEELMNKAKEDLEEMKKLPNFDDHPVVMTYQKEDEKEGDGEEGENSDKNQTEDGSGEEKDSEETTKKEETGSEEGDGDEEKDKKDSKESQTGNPLGAGGDDVAVQRAPDEDMLRAITDDYYENKKDSLLDKEHSYKYVNLPKSNLKNTMTTYKEFLKEMDTNNRSSFTGQWSTDHVDWYRWLQQKFKRFKKNNHKTVMYLVKEFEMKKSASAYKRASIDKTGIIDPLKLKDYKFSEDIFKRLTILPDDKNHGMMMLLDWSGSMSDVIDKTVHQLLNLIWFCQKVQIPFEVYLFNDSKKHRSDRTRHQCAMECFNFKEGDLALDYVNLVNVASHRMKKKELEKSCLYLFQLAEYYTDRYSWYRRRRNGSGMNDEDIPKGSAISIPERFYLSSTPLNEALVACQDLVPMMKKKYNIEKMTFITLTDGGANGGGSNVWKTKVDEVSGKDEFAPHHEDGETVVIKDGKKFWYQQDNEDSYWRTSENLTSTLLDMIRKKYGVKAIGFFILKNNRRWEFDRHVENYKTINGRMTKINDRDLMRKKFLKDKSLAISKDGYDEYYLLNGTSMDVQNVDLSTLKEDAKKGDIKRLFGKSMANRLISRVVLSKFIQQVA